MLRSPGDTGSSVQRREAVDRCPVSLRRTSSRRHCEGFPDPNATLVSTDAGEFVRDLKAKPGKDICILGGGDFGRSLFAAGVIDEVGVNIHPILLGAGVPLFLDTGQRISLELIENRTIDGGCVLATYRVRH
jgi:dihydrofolate reductase